MSLLLNSLFYSTGLIVCYTYMINLDGWLYKSSNFDFYDLLFYQNFRFSMSVFTKKLAVVSWVIAPFRENWYLYNVKFSNSCALYTLPFIYSLFIRSLIFSKMICSCIYNLYHLLVIIEWCFLMLLYIVSFIKLQFFLEYITTIDMLIFSCCIHMQ